MRGGWKDRGRKHGLLALLGICERTIVARLPHLRPAVIVTLKRRHDPPENPKTLGDHLFRARTHRQMTTLQVAQLLGVARQTYEEWERNSRKIPTARRLKVIGFIGQDPENKSAKSNG
jgi:DNA-binding transcriptional regulator YiaG